MKALLIARWHRLRPWVFRLSCVVTLAGVLMVRAVQYHAEKNLLLVCLAYLPFCMLVMPWCCTVMLGLLFACWRTILLSLGGMLWLLFSLGQYQLPWLTPDHPPSPSENSLTVMTYNRGQGADATLWSFVQEMCPDFVALQDAGRRLPRLLALPGFSQQTFHSEIGEFVLLSRWPILANESLVMLGPGSTKAGRTVGVRSVVDWQGRQIVVYNLHMPTPRDLLSWYGTHGTFLYGLLGLVPVPHCMSAIANI